MSASDYFVSALPAPNVDISFSGKSTAGEEYSMQCSASLVEDLIVLPELEIVLHNSTITSVMGDSSLLHTFSPLRTSDGGVYTCTATINILQAHITNLQASVTDTIIVAGQYNTHLCYMI